MNFNVNLNNIKLLTLEKKIMLKKTCYLSKKNQIFT